MRRAITAALMLLAGCDRAAMPASDAGAGAALERAALASGVVPDPAALDPAGAYGSETDRLCITRRAAGMSVGAAVDYGEGQQCVARGTAEGRGNLRLRFGADCRIDARFDGERIVFPATVPPACDRRCRGRATFSALTVTRLSGSQTEARSMRAPDGKPLCNG